MARSSFSNYQDYDRIVNNNWYTESFKEANWLTDYWDIYKNKRQNKGQEKVDQSLQSVRNKESQIAYKWLSAFQDNFKRYDSEFNQMKKDFKDLVLIADKMGVDFDVLAPSSTAKFDEIVNNVSNILESGKQTTTAEVDINVRTAQITPQPYINKFNTMLANMEKFYQKLQVFMGNARKNITTIDPTRLNGITKLYYDQTAQILGINQPTPQNTQQQPNSSQMPAATPSSATSTTQQAPSQPTDPKANLKLHINDAAQKGNISTPALEISLDYLINNGAIKVAKSNIVFKKAPKSWND